MTLPTIDSPSLFRINEAGDQYESTLRDMLILAAGAATEDAEQGIREHAHSMLALFKAPGTPKLDYWQVRAFTEVVEAAKDYETDAQTDEVDRYSTDEEKAAAALTWEADSLITALDYLSR